MKDNTLYNMDNMEGLARMTAASVDLVVTSPPYDDLRTYNGFSFDYEALVPELYRVVKPGGVVVWIVADQTKDGSETGTSFRQALCFQSNGFNIYDTMIWQKTTSFPTTNRYYNAFEYMFVFSKGRPSTATLICDKRNRHAGVLLHGTERRRDGTLVPVARRNAIKPFGVRTNVWDIPGEKKNRTDHPAVFPVRLVRDHILSWSRPGDLVVDPFMGSGTTALACLETGRRYIGFEISEKYHRDSLQRVKEHCVQCSFD